MSTDTHHVPAPAETVTVVQAAALLGIGRDLAYRAVASGELPAVRIGRRLVVPLAQLDHLLTGEQPTAVRRKGGER